MNTNRNSMPELGTASTRIHGIITRLLDLASKIEKESQTKLAPVMVPSSPEDKKDALTQRIPGGIPPLFVEMGNNLLDLEAILKKVEKMLNRVNI